MIHRRAGEEQLSSPAGTDMWWKVSIGMPHLIYLWGGGVVWKIDELWYWLIDSTKRNKFYDL